MSRIAIVFHSGYGHTRVVADRIKAGADALVFGSPTYMGNVSGPFKMFMDASSKAWFEQKWKDKLAAGFTISGSPSGDKLNTLQSLMIFAMQHGMVWVGNAEMPGHEAGINRLGSFTGLMAQAGQVPPEVEPNEPDRKTAERLGQRVAVCVHRWRQGAR